MIIIETKKGPKFVNEQTIESVEFNKEKGEVYIHPISELVVGRIPFATDVEEVIYTSEPFHYSWNGSRVEDMERQCIAYRMRIIHLEEEIENLKHSNPKT